MKGKNKSPRLKPLSLVPLTVDEALSALLKTPPPKGEQRGVNGKARKRKAAKKR